MYLKNVSRSDVAEQAIVCSNIALPPTYLTTNSSAVAICRPRLQMPHSHYRHTRDLDLGSPS